MLLDGVPVSALEPEVLHRAVAYAFERPALVGATVAGTIAYGRPSAPAAEVRAEQAFSRRPGSLVVVAHRISSAMRADRILVMDGPGPVLGTHQELLGTSPLYADLVGYWEGDRPAPAVTPPATPAGS